MNAERFHALLLALQNDVTTTRVRENLTALVAALTNQVSQPNEPTYQTAVAEARRVTRDALDAAPSNSFPPTWLQAIDEMDIGKLLGGSVSAKMDAAFTELAATPAAILEWAQDALQKQEALWAQITGGLSALDYFDVGAEVLSPGEFELSVSVPRGVVHEHLGELGKEFAELERIILPFVELTTGSRPQLDVKTISSSDFTVVLALIPGVAVTIAKSIDWVIATYEKLRDIKEHHQALKEKEVPDAVLAPIEEYANTVMATGIDEAVTALTSEHEAVVKTARMHEVSMELKLSLNAIANRIDKGYHIEVRVQPLEVDPAAADDETNSNGSEAADLIRHIEAVQSRSQRMRFLDPAGSPILALPEGA
jgi:hypothetical protein